MIELFGIALLAMTTCIVAARQCVRGRLPVKRNLGISSYLDLLVADRLYSGAKVGYIQAFVVRFQDTSALFVAFGGGGWNAH